MVEGGGGRWRVVDDGGGWLAGCTWAWGSQAHPAPAAPPAPGRRIAAPPPGVRSQAVRGPSREHTWVGKARKRPVLKRLRRARASRRSE